MSYWRNQRAGIGSERICSLLEVVGESEDKRGDLPGKGNSTSKGVAGTDSIRSIWGSMRDERDLGGADGKSRSLGVGLSLWRCLGIVKPLEDFTQGSIGVTVACTKAMQDVN